MAKLGRLALGAVESRSLQANTDASSGTSSRRGRIRGFLEGGVVEACRSPYRRFQGVPHLCPPSLTSRAHDRQPVLREFSLASCFTSAVKKQITPALRRARDPRRRRRAAACRSP